MKVRSRKRKSSNPWHIYLLRCRGGSLYAGITNNLARRVAAHDSGKGAKYTRSRRPVVLVWSRKMRSATAARKEEARIKKLEKGEKELVVGLSRDQRSEIRRLRRD